MENKPIISAKMSESGGCICDACHEIAKVIQLKLPRTKYFDGEKLTTELEVQG